MTTLTIKSQKGASILLAADSKGFVTATVNGTEYRGNHAWFGVQMFGSKAGEYVQLATGIAALIAAIDIAPARTFFAAARHLADAATRDAALAQHEADMRDPAYAARIAHDRLAEDMDHSSSDR